MTFSADEVQHQITTLKPIIQEELRSRDAALTLTGSAGDLLLNDALNYLHGTTENRVGYLGRIGKGFMPSDDLTIDRLLIICEIVGRYKQHVVFDRLDMLKVSLHKIDAPRQERIRFEDLVSPGLSHTR